MLLLRRGLEAQGELGMSTVLLQNSATGSRGLGPQSWWEHVGSPRQTQPSNIPPPSWLQGGQCAGQGWASPSLLSASHPLIPLLSSAVQTTIPPSSNIQLSRPSPGLLCVCSPLHLDAAAGCVPGLQKGLCSTEANSQGLCVLFSSHPRLQTHSTGSPFLSLGDISGKSYNFGVTSHCKDDLIFRY